MNSNEKAVIREIPGNLGLVSYFHFGNNYRVILGSSDYLI